ncbi:hypothetical protein [Bradyrhizobium sp. CCBAU 45384]|uniref:hypothetical protein n=1 Tax=Bradyrhizobium sp. CCBAU 45384 TaxID=858428 RepID=UPI0023061562|nr:hypothetical protein [Bradyrhizobium sp. CCBAU 45384]
MDSTRKRTGKDRIAAYRARLAGEREPPAYVVANACLSAVIEARMNGETGLDPALFTERAAEIVIADGNFSREGFDNFLGQFTQSGNRAAGLPDGGENMDIVSAGLTDGERAGTCTCWRTSFAGRSGVRAERSSPNPSGPATGGQPPAAWGAVTMPTLFRADTLWLDMDYVL